MALSHGDFTCDGCGVWCDLDPVALVGQADTYGVTDPVKVRELTYFWLCGDCSPEYPAGAKDFFVESYFVPEIPYCVECESEDVPEWGQTCSYC